MALCLLSWSHLALTLPDSDSEIKLTHLVLDGCITGAQSFGLTLIFLLPEHYQFFWVVVF